MDLHHVQPKLVEKFSDRYGFLGLYACSLSNTLITCGNRVYPYTLKEARSAFAQHTNSFGVTTEEEADLEEIDFSSLPSTLLFYGAFQEDCPLQPGLSRENQLCNFRRINTLKCPVNLGGVLSCRTEGVRSTPFVLQESTPPRLTGPLTMQVLFL